MELEVEKLVEEASAGDLDARAELYRRFVSRVFGLCRHLLGSREAAEEATSEVFLRVEKNIGSYDGSVPFVNWLFSVASHYCIDQLRRRHWEQRFIRVDPDVATGLAASALSPLNEVLMREERQEIKGAIGRLPDKYRLPLVLKYYGDLSYDEIAEQLGLARANVATLIFRAKQELRLILGSRKGEHLT